MIVLGAIPYGTNQLHAQETLNTASGFYNEKPDGGGGGGGLSNSQTVRKSNKDQYAHHLKPIV